MDIRSNLFYQKHQCYFCQCKGFFSLMLYEKKFSLLLSRIFFIMLVEKNVTIIDQRNGIQNFDRIFFFY